MKESRERREDMGQEQEQEATDETVQQRSSTRGDLRPGVVGAASPGRHDRIPGGPAEGPSQAG